MKVLIGRMVSDDQHGDIPGKRLAIAKYLAHNNRAFDAQFPVSQLWVINRMRDARMKERFFEALGCSEQTPRPQDGTGQLVYRSREISQTSVIDLPYYEQDLDRHHKAEQALLYMLNPNLARNVVLRHAQEQGFTHVAVFDGDIYIPPETWADVSRLLANSPTVPIWLFCVRSESVEDFSRNYSDNARGSLVIDSCDNQFILRSSPIQLIRRGYEGMLILPLPTAPFDESRLYGNDDKVSYCKRLSQSTKLQFSSMPVCHLEHRAKPQTELPEEGCDLRVEQLGARGKVRRKSIAELTQSWEENYEKLHRRR